MILLYPVTVGQWAVSKSPRRKKLGTPLKFAFMLQIFCFLPSPCLQRPRASPAPGFAGAWLALYSSPG